MIYVSGSQARILDQFLNSLSVVNEFENLRFPNDDVNVCVYYPSLKYYFVLGLPHLINSKRINDAFLFIVGFFRTFFIPSVCTVF